MGGPAYHGRTHLPGGTDPITVAAGGGLKWAVVRYGQQSHTVSAGTIRLRFNGLETNDSSLFTLEDLTDDTIRSGTNQWADFLGLNEAGYYLCLFQANTIARNAFDGFDTYIEPLDGEAGPLISIADYAQWFSGLSPTAEFYATPEWDHGSLWGSIGLWHDPALNTLDPFKIGLRVQTDKTGAVTIGAQMLVLQMASLATGAYVDNFIG